MKKKLLLIVLSSSVMSTGFAMANQQTTTFELAAKPKTKVVKADLKNGKKVYTKTCLMCHGSTGKGDGPAGKALKARDLVNGKFLWGTTDKDLQKTITKGNGKMPPFKLSDKDLNDVIAYIRSLKPPAKKK